PAGRAGGDAVGGDRGSDASGDAAPLRAGGGLPRGGDPADRARLLPGVPALRLRAPTGPAAPPTLLETGERGRCCRSLPVTQWARRGEGDPAIEEGAGRARRQARIETRGKPHAVASTRAAAGGHGGHGARPVRVGRAHARPAALPSV